ncbi:TRAP-type mannitol/chloroaromatic compound transport system, small permease component [Octadecabacter temperatus]|uniref:TRAP transporter small permease protein n=1 Tax=Octadecabacter temperatus TaxID=1458307 RepID=A0A0K0Y313_9RHOB|nr:TRAP transporter small permease [Octadecabacter temperatus]AKS45345.1 Tripartite ATP-independent periplasmic transporter, DctQ component [Octadecabacter temperatus]SIN90964.1 TRAP-type mannitol/chloroaromatic compound transport system, small permease component [Octadecabacter temperatus]
MSSETEVQRSILARLNKVLMPIEDLANLLAAFAIMALMFLGVLQIVMRTVFNTPITGYIDLVELSMASMAFLGAAYTQRLGSHIRMELLVGKLSGRALWALEAFGAAVAMFIIGVLIYYSYGHFLRAYTLGDTTIDAEYVTWPSKLLVPIAFSIWWCRLALQCVGALRLVINPTADPIGVVIAKDVAEQAKDEIHEVMGDDADLTDPGAS